MMLCLSACAMAGSDEKADRPPVVEYSGADMNRVSDQVDALPESALIVRMLTDYAVLRDEERASR